MGGADRRRVSWSEHFSVPRFKKALCNYLIGIRTVVVDCFFPKEHTSENELELVVFRSFHWNQLVVIADRLTLHSGLIGKGGWPGKVRDQTAAITKFLATEGRDYYADTSTCYQQHGAGGAQWEST